MGATDGGTAPFPNAKQRLEGLADESIPAEVREAMGPWWPPFNLHRVLAHNPATLRAWMVFGNHILRNNLLGERLRELVVLRVAWNARSAYEWGQHAGLSRRLGIPEADIARVMRGPRARGWTQLEAAALSGVDQLMKRQSIDPDTYAALAEHLSPAQLLDYIFLIGEFILVALALNAFQIARDPGLSDMPAAPARRRRPEPAGRAPAPSAAGPAAGRGSAGTGAAPEAPAPGRPARAARARGQPGADTSGQGGSPARQSREGASGPGAPDPGASRPRRPGKGGSGTGAKS